jgi:hypothetical protein
MVSRHTLLRDQFLRALGPSPRIPLFTPIRLPRGSAKTSRTG